MKKYIEYYTPPNAVYYPMCERILSAPHCLIAGATGSGKSVLLNDIIYTALIDSPALKRFIFIDLKRVELIDYKFLPHTIRYCDNTQSVEQGIEIATDLIEMRYQKMQEQKIKKSQDCDVYIVIDEYAELVTDKNRKKRIEPNLMRIAQIGRAANVHIILCTQRPTRDVISGQIKVNIDTCVALRTASALDSRNILGVAGAEKLDRFGTGLFQQYGYIEKITIPITTDIQIQDRVSYWKSDKCSRIFYK